MEKSRKFLVVTVIAVIAFGGILALTVSAEGGMDSEVKKHERINSAFNSSVKSLKLDQNPASSFSTIQTIYDNVILSKYENRLFDGNQKLQSLDNNIENQLNTIIFPWRKYNLLVSQIDRLERLRQQGAITKEELQAQKESLFEQFGVEDLADSYNQAKKATSKNKISELHSDVSKMMNSLGMGLPLAYEQPTLIVLGLVFLLSLIVTISCRKIIDWDAVGEARAVLKDWRSGLKESGQKSGKKKKKKDVEEEKIRDNHGMMWRESFKQGIMYLFPFLALLAWLFQIYGGKIFAWMPFSSSFTIGWVGVSLDLVGWSILCYLVFSYVLRFFLIPER